MTGRNRGDGPASSANGANWALIIVASFFASCFCRYLPHCFYAECPHYAQISSDPRQARQVITRFYRPQQHNVNGSRNSVSADTQRRCATLSPHPLAPGTGHRRNTRIPDQRPTGGQEQARLSARGSVALDCIRILRSAFSRLLSCTGWLLGEPADEVFQDRSHRPRHQPVRCPGPAFQASRRGTAARNGAAGGTGYRNGAG